MIRIHPLGILLAAELLIAPLLAKPGGSVEQWQAGHNVDMAEVIGISRQSSPAVRKKWHIITKKFADMIDSLSDASALKMRIQRHAPAFNWSTYSHRIFFHWGFNTLPYAPNSATALGKRINLALDQLPPEKRAAAQRAIWEEIREAQRLRNQQMIAAIPIPDRQARSAVASILYNVHLLGDYINGAEGPTTALYPLDFVVNDIINAVNKLRCNDAAAKKTLVNKLRAAKRSRNALKVLDTLKAELPGVISKSPYKKYLLSDK